MKNLNYLFSFILLIGVYSTANADWIKIPDRNLELALIDLGYDDGIPDGEFYTIFTHEDVTSLNLDSRNISDLTGIEGFTSLEELSCKNNNLTEIDLETNNKLKKLDCSNNSISELEVTYCRYLEELNCSNNLLTELSFVGKYSKNYYLKSVDCSNNQLYFINIKNGDNGDIKSFSASGNDVECCILVDDNSAGYMSGWVKDEGANFINNIGECNGKIIYVPDDKFERALIILGYDDVMDDFVKKDSISSVTSLEIEWEDIADLTGIKGFTALKELVCYGNELGSLDLSENLALEELDCSMCNLSTLILPENSILEYINLNDNGIRNIDVSDYPELNILYCNSNYINSLDLSNNKELEYLSCSSNPITNLDVSNNEKLRYLSADYIDLEFLDTRNNAKLGLLSLDYCGELKYVDLRNGNNENLSFSAATSNNLECIIVDDADADYLRDWNGHYLSLLMDTERDCKCFMTYLPDQNFEKALWRYGCDNGVVDNYVFTPDIRKMTEVYVHGYGIEDLSGIEEFWALEKLTCSGNELKNLDVSKNYNLKELYVDKNPLEHISVPNNQKLEKLDISENNFTSFDFSQFPQLTYLKCCLNELEIDVSKNTLLEELYCSRSALTSLDLSNNPDVKILDISNNQLPVFDFSILTELVDLSCSSIGLTDLDVSKNLKLRFLDCDSNNLKQIDLSLNTKLSQIECFDNELTSLNLANNKVISSIKCQNNEITNLELPNSTSLEKLFCSGNKLETLDLSSYWRLEGLDCSNNNLFSVDVRTGYNDDFYKFDARNNENLTCIFVDDKSAEYLGGFYWRKDEHSNFIESESECGLYINIPDDNFEQALIDLGYDSGNLDDIVLVANINTVTKLDVSGKNIIDLTGIEGFAALEELNCRENSLTGIDVSKNKNLVELYCDKNKLTGLDLSNNTSLSELSCAENQLTGLDVSKNKALENLQLGNNQIAKIDLSNNTALTVLGCQHNQLKRLDVSANTALTSLDCPDNQLTSLELIVNKSLVTIDCSKNKLVFFNIRNGNNTGIQNFDASGNEGLTCIFVDDNTAGYLSGWKKDDAANFVNSERECSLYTYIPDDNFEQALIDLGYDSGNLDDIVLVANINTVTKLDVSGKNIIDLTGIEGFAALEELNCRENSLTGIDVSKNKNLVELYCDKNKLTGLDLSNNTSLSELSCAENQLTGLDVSKNIALEKLQLGNNQIAKIDLSNNTALTVLGCQHNQLKRLDVSANTALTSLDCPDNQLTSLELIVNKSLVTVDCGNNKLVFFDIRNGNNTGIQNFDASGNEGLTCIYVDDNTAGYLSGWKKDDAANFVNSERECSLYTYIPDDNFEQALIDLGYDSGNLDDIVPVANINTVTKLDVSGKNIIELTGIEGFAALEELNCRENSLTGIDVSKNKNLVELYCDKNKLTGLDLSNNTSLSELSCAENQLTGLDVSKNIALENLQLGNNQIAKIDLSNNTALTVLDCHHNQLTGLELIVNKSLVTVDCSKNKLVFFDIRNGNNTGIQNFDASGNEGLTCIFVDDNTAGYLSGWKKDDTADFANSERECGLNTYVPDDNFEQALIDLGYDSGNLDDIVPVANINTVTKLDVSGKNIIELTGIEGFAALEELNCRENSLTGIDVSKNKNLVKLYCDKNKLTGLDLSNNISLSELSCAENQLKGLDLVKNKDLTTVDCSKNKLVFFDIRNGNNTGIQNFDASGNEGLTCIFVDDNTAGYLSGWKKDDAADFANSERECGLNTYVPDDNFEQALIDLGYDSGNLDDIVPVANINTVTKLDVSGKNISDLTGIEGFAALEELNCRENSLTGIDVSKNKNLVKLYCDKNKLTGLDLSNNISLSELSCAENQLKGLDLVKNKDLTTVGCSKNKLVFFDIRNGNNTGIQNFDASGNEGLTCIFVDDNTAGYLSGWKKDDAADFANSERECGLNTYVPDDNFEQALIELGYDSGNLDDIVPVANINTVTKLDISGKNISDLTGIEGFAVLEELNCRENSLTGIDVSKNKNLVKLYCDKNKLTGLDLSNNTSLSELSCAENQLKGLDLVKNKDLTTVDCSKNKLVFFDIRNGNNTGIQNFDASGNEGLTCIFVDDNTAGYLSGWKKDDAADFANSERECGLNTYVPDDNFEQALIDLGYDSGNLDDIVPEANINTVTKLDVSGKNIIELTGIEGFAALEELNCRENSLTGIDVSKNKNLVKLYCDKNKLTGLDLSNNISLSELSCAENQLKGLDLVKNKDLTTVDCSKNKLVFFDIRNGNNTGIQNFDASGNEGLTCIFVDDNTAGYLKNWIKDASAKFVNSVDECNTSAIELVVNRDFQMYPNPTKGSLHFNFGTHKVLRLQVLDMQGALLLEKNIVKQQETIELEQFACGVYLVAVFTQNGNIAVKVIKE